ncbi:Uncharacterised protein [Mycobacteroides abscessus subsp. abscessus]|nr:Uncharacterised protein [Mycobacteroides abscessus subsp. abscessus]
MESWMKTHAVVVWIFDRLVRVVLSFFSALGLGFRVREDSLSPARVMRRHWQCGVWVGAGELVDGLGASSA